MDAIKVHNAAKLFLLEYMSDGKEKKPSDFDQDIIGGIEILSVTTIFNKPRWNRTPFCDALGALIVEGKIEYRIDNEGAYCYKLTKK